MTCMTTYTMDGPSTQSTRDMLSMMAAFLNCRLEWISDNTAEIYHPVAMF